MAMKLILTLAAISSAALAADPVSLFNGKDLSNWEAKAGKSESKWAVGEPKTSAEKPELLTITGTAGAMVNLAAKHGDSLDFYSKEKFGSCRIELDFMVPKGSNSGIYVMGEYEVQVFDSYGKANDKMGPGDMGAIYGAAVPKVNASKPAGEWQHFVIEWQAPKFDAQGMKTANAKFIKVELNGQVLHENLEMKSQTPGGVTGKEHAEGPIMFQGNHGAVAYKNIKVTAL